MKFKKVKTFTVEGQQHSEVKVVYGRVFQTMRLIDRNGTIVLTKRFFRLNKMPRWLGKIFVQIYRKPSERLQKKILKLDARLGQKEEL